MVTLGLQKITKTLNLIFIEKAVKSMQHVIKLKTIVSIHFEKVSICNSNMYLVNWKF